jgi:hypothetical protein
VDFDPVGSEPSDLILDELRGDPSAVRERGHASDEGGEFAEVAAPLGIGRSRKLSIGAPSFALKRTVVEETWVWRSSWQSTLGSMSSGLFLRAGRRKRLESSQTIKKTIFPYVLTIDDQNATPCSETSSSMSLARIWLGKA